LHISRIEKYLITMEQIDKAVAGEWITAAELALPTDYQKICACPMEQIEKGHSALEQTSNRKLAEFYDGMGTGEMRSLKSKLFFVAAMLLEQTASGEHNRDMVAKIRELHRQNPLYPSVATVYRISAPLKVWLGRKSGIDPAPSVGELRTDRRPLLLLGASQRLRLAA
jgi:hypothetical protein